MHQVLFHVPIVNFPLSGFGAMLFLSLVFCVWLASWLAKKEGIDTRYVQDIAFWIFVCGIIGARATYMIQYKVPITEFYRFWEGGLVFYGSAIGGVVGYFVAYVLVLRRYSISTWKMADVIAPCGALGLCIGRIGCLLNGCCYGNVASPDCPAIHFPLPAHPRFVMTEKGYQTAAGFTISTDFDAEASRRVGRVEPGSAAYVAGLRDGDVVQEVNGSSAFDLYTVIGDHREWPRGKNDLVLKVRHQDGNVQSIGPFEPETIGLHPTQIYESISTGLLCLLLLAFYPFRPCAGAVMVLFMLCYAVHRFLNEALRVDTDNVAFNMTLSQNLSLVVLVCGLLLAAVLWRTQQRKTALVS
jgi:phosphatidylglycerol---prolipoprotein diacylglyceryl transferase